MNLNIELSTQEIEFVLSGLDKIEKQLSTMITPDNGKKQTVYFLKRKFVMAKQQAPKQGARI